MPVRDFIVRALGPVMSQAMMIASGRVWPAPGEKQLKAPVGSRLSDKELVPAMRGMAITRKLGLEMGTISPEFSRQQQPFDLLSRSLDAVFAPADAPPPDIKPRMGESPLILCRNFMTLCKPE